MTADARIAVSTPRGEAYFALAMKRQLWRRLRSFPRRPLMAHFPPKAVIAAYAD